MSNTDILITEDALDNKQFKELQSVLMGFKFKWGYNDTVAYNDNLEERNDILHFQFTHDFYQNHTIKSEYFNLLFPFFEILNPKALIRIKANLCTRSDIIIEHKFHRDQQFDCKVAIAYINTNDGYTLFDTGQKIMSVENRLVEFHSSLPHTGTTCTNQSTRVLINFNYF